MIANKPNLIARRSLVIAIGFFLGLFHVGLFLLSATGAGHGPDDFARFVGPTFFGIGSVFWFILPPFQYALYADTAFRRDGKLGLWLAIFHYGSALLTLLYTAKGSGRDAWHSEIHWNTFTLDFIVTYSIFIVLNILYFRRILSSPK